MKPQPPRTPSKLSDSVHHQLNLYALAASAAGVGVLALAQPAEAKIVYTKTHEVIGSNSSYHLDLNHDGITDFTLNNSSNCPTATMICNLWLSLTPAHGNRAIGYVYYRVWDSALRPGVRVGPGGGFQKGQGELVGVIHAFATYVFGPWASNTKARYLGLKFGIKGETHYGWARLNVKAAWPSITATLTGYAYETIPNKPIVTGKTKGLDVITVQPASLGRLAQGSAGLAAWRSGK